MPPDVVKRFLTQRLPSWGWGNTWQVWLWLTLLTLGYAAIASTIYLQAGLGQWSPQLKPLEKTLLLSAGFFILPALVEEAFWRCALIAPRHLGSLTRASVSAIVLSTLLFTAAHPVAALIFVPHARGVFLHPAFLAIVFLLGLTCGVAYVWSKSVWPPTLIHWVTVLAWKFLLGGPFVLLGR